jgi:hypothetical protein
MDMPMTHQLIDLLLDMGLAVASLQTLTMMTLILTQTVGCTIMVTRFPLSTHMKTHLSQFELERIRHGRPGFT